ncbi:HAD hydrolase-like protein, partial [Streptosporangium algeriense]
SATSSRWSQNRATSPKNRAEIVHAACAAIGLPAERVAYVGDRHDVDAAAANAAGLYGVWLNRTGAPAPAGLPAVRSLEELPALLGFRRGE